MSKDHLKLPPEPLPKFMAPINAPYLSFGSEPLDDGSFLVTVTYSDNEQKRIGFSSADDMLRYLSRMTAPPSFARHAPARQQPTGRPFPLPVDEPEPEDHRSVGLMARIRGRG